MPPSPSRPHPLKRTLALLAILAVCLGAWTCTRLSPARIALLKYRIRLPLAERIAGTPLQKTRWAQRLLGSFAQPNVYRAANLALPPAPPDRIILYGDSITEYWPLVAPDTLAAHPGLIDRGIAGQTTTALLWRLQQDVLDLHPATVVLLGGANDVLYPVLHVSAAETDSNLRRMATLAQQHGIRVLLCAVLPVRVGSQPDNDRIAATNASLQTFAAQNHLTFVDYFHAMADARGELPAALSADGIHPNHAGYQIMAATLNQALAANTPTRGQP